MNGKTTFEMNRNSTLVIAALSALLALQGCTAKPDSEVLNHQPPLVTQAKTTQNALKPSAAPDQAEAPSVQVTLVADKKALLSQEFLYGSDLQYSSIYDKEYDLYTQSLVLGHVPARFRIVGDELQLVTENKEHFPSDVNHPEQLITRFKILTQTDSTITISGANSSAYLTQMMQMLAGKKPGSADAPGYQDHWIRSFEFDPNGNYLLQQTSVMLADGSIGEFMEAIFPRATIAPSASFQKFEMDPTDLVGAAEGPVARFRMLGGDTIHDGEKKLAYAQHFDVTETSTIDWYVTRNIPEEQLETVAMAIEGWNRYFVRQKGIERKVLRFMGKLPEHVHLGDPRYNVISWDSRLIAGAAYESQASDPATGKQSHSMIYMPAAWLEIGSTYWKRGVSSDPASKLPGKLRTRKAPSALLKHACARDLREAAALLASGAVSTASTEEEIKTFAKELARGTLFHELGHALGLAHNFKGSLSFDKDRADTIFSTSIMDYNNYESERQAFFGAKSSEGPLLEYDRQIISTLYNQGRDISESDPVVPACADAEADFEEGQVDPLCIRYDIEKDPTLSVVTAYKRVTELSLEGRPTELTLAEALPRVPRLALEDSRIEKIQTKEDFLAAASETAASLKGAIRFFVQSSSASLAKTAATNVKSLLVFDESALPEGYDAAAMRERAYQGVRNTMALTVLPEKVKTSISAALQLTLDRLSQAPYARSLGSTETSALLKEVGAKIEKSVISLETDPVNGLPKARIYVLNALMRHETVPFYLGGKDSRSAKDYETAIVQLVSGIAGDTLRTAGERIAATQTLTTYSGRLTAEGALRKLRTQVTAERKNARDNDSRELAEQLLDILRVAGK